MANNQIIPVTRGDGTVVVETELSITDITYIQALNGRQYVDTFRTVKFQFVKHGIPINIQGMTPQIVGKDAQDKIKQISNVVNVVSQEAGLVEMAMTQQMYLAAGPYQEAYIRLIKDDGSAYSSVPIMFNVLESGIVVTSNVEEHYIQTIDDMVQTASDNLGKKTANLDTEIKTALDKITDLQTAENELATRLTGIKADVDQQNYIRADVAQNINVPWAMKDLTVDNLKATANGKVNVIKQDTYDLNDLTALKMKKNLSITTEHVYGTKIINGPEGATNPSFILQTYVSGDTIFQMYTSLSSNLVVAKRMISGIVTLEQPIFGSWQFISGTSGLQSLVPYLTSDFTRYSATDAEPMFAQVGNLVVLRGRVTPTKTLTMPDITTTYTIATKLPVKFTNFQNVLEVGSNGRTFSLNTLNDSLTLSGHVNGAGEPEGVQAGFVLSISGVFLIE